MSSELDIWREDRFAQYANKTLWEPSYTDTSKLSQEEKELVDLAVNKSWINPKFKMKNFVAGDHVTPFHQLRQMLIELRSTEEQIETLEFNMKKYPVELKVQELKIADPNSTQEEKLLAEIAKIDIENNLKVSKRRCTAYYIERHLYLDLIKEFLDSDAGKTADGRSLMEVFNTPEEDAYEHQYWTLRLAKQAAMDMICYGNITAGNLSAITCLGEQQQNEIYSVAHKYTLEMREHQEEIRKEMSVLINEEKQQQLASQPTNKIGRDQNNLENSIKDNGPENLSDVYNL